MGYVFIYFNPVKNRHQPDFTNASIFFWKKKKKMWVVDFFHSTNSILVEPLILEILPRHHIDKFSDMTHT